jgi:eukaryotic-like serine/threonine-protein kinase
VETATLKGEAMPLAQQLVPVNAATPEGGATFSASSNGVLVFRSGATSVLSQLTWVDRRGMRRRGVGPPGYYRNPALSPDGTRIAVEVPDLQSGTQDIWVMDVASGVSNRFTFDPANDVYPIWSPDGKRIAFGSDRVRRDGFRAYQKSADGVGTEALMVESDKDLSPLSWSTDGRFVVFRTRFPFPGVNLAVLPVLGELSPYNFETVNFVQGQGQVSPDGRWLAYNSNESARYEINVQSFPKPGGGKWQVSKDGGSFPRWRRDGKELYYYASDGRLMAVPVGGTTGLEVGAAVALFEPGLVNGPANTSGYRAQYDASPDGQGFLLNVPIDPSAESPITVILNWPSLMR